MSQLFSVEFWSLVAVTAGIFTIFGLGLQVQFGVTGLLNFGHVAFMAIGAYTMAILVVRTELPMALAAVIAIGAAIAFGLFIGLPTLRLRADYLAIATIAFGEIVRYIALNESGLTGGPQGTINLLGQGIAASYNTEWQQLQGRVQDLLGVGRNGAMMIMVWSVIAVLLPLLHYMVRSPWGRVLRSIREDEDAARALGKHVFFYKLQALAIGASLGALAGLFHAWHFSFFNPQDFEPLVTFFAYVIVILAGAGSLWGVPVGALIFALLFAVTRFFDFWPLDLLASAERAYLRLIMVGLLLIFLMAFRPQGMFGKREEMVLDR